MKETIMNLEATVETLKADVEALKAKLAEPAAPSPEDEFKKQPIGCFKEWMFNYLSNKDITSF